MRVGVFHPGTQHSWQTALAFQEAGELAWYATSVFYDPTRWPYRIERWLPRTYADRLNREFRRRHFPPLDPALVRQFGLYEWLETAAFRLKRDRLARRLNDRGNIAFGRSVIKLAGRERVDAVWGYNSSSAEVFRWAKRQGILCVLDQTVGHYRALNEVLGRERETYSEYFDPSYRPHGADVLDRQDEEAELADLIVVGSEFCAETMVRQGTRPEKIRVVPYGYNEALLPSGRPTREPIDGRPVRFLFVGSVEPRKGVHYLLEAIREIPVGRASLTLVGRPYVPETTLARFTDRVRFVPSLPRTEVVRHFLEADCFIFPSLFEGSALVLYEACGSGLGMIRSRSSGTPVGAGRNGRVLDTISTPSLTEAIWDVVNHPDRLAAWQDESWRLRSGLTWGSYRHSLPGLLRP